jgi:hypothetical protein
MGNCCGRPAHRNVQQLNLFAEEPEIKEGASTGVNGGPEEKQLIDDDFDPDAMYTFSALMKEVFTVGRDCIFDDPTGPACGKIAGVYETVDYFGQKILQLTLNVIKSNGNLFFKGTQYCNVPIFQGELPLKELPLRPILKKEKAVLKERGKLFQKYGIGPHYVYNSAKMFVRGWAGVSRISDEGRVVCDTASFLHFNPNYSSLSEGAYLGNNNGNQISVGGRGDGGSATTIPQSSLHLCWPTICGFSLKTKKWGEILVDALGPIQFREDAFEKLVIPPNTKDLIRGLVENQQSNQFTDIISGKGGGCVFLLHGAPGTGKTLTAEAIAELLHKPLYTIDVGELGITPTDLEAKLQQILEVAERWDAVVLIDEADIFLEARGNSDVLRNAMVGIFLRLLEYHNGVLFLTSNRVSELDEAFQSRISVALHYKNLAEETRKQVWNNLLESAELKEMDCEKLSKYQLNGRQIKTAIRLAISLAKAKKSEGIDMSHVVETVDLIEGFNKELSYILKHKFDNFSVPEQKE